MGIKIQRNEKCPCGSGIKYKKCCYIDPTKNAEIARAAFLASDWDEMVQILSKPMEVYRLQVILTSVFAQEIEDEVTRTIDVEGDDTLYDLHMIIQYAFDWDNDHMFSFYFGGKLFDRSNEYSGNPLGEHDPPGIGKPNKSAAEAQIRDFELIEGSVFLYLFDYGDELIHEVRVEKIRNKTDADNKLPSIVKKTGNPPYQY